MTPEEEATLKAEEEERERQRKEQAQQQAEQLALQAEQQKVIDNLYKNATENKQPDFTIPEEQTPVVKQEIEDGKQESVVTAQQQDEKEQEDADIAYAKQLEDANKQQEWDFQQYVLDMDKRISEEKARAQQQETADAFAGLSTGATQTMASIINMLGVGGLHASHQQYRDVAQDWMRRADANAKENRRRMDSLVEARDRLKRQQDQIRNANLKESLSVQYKLAKDREAAAAKALADAKKQEEIERKEELTKLAQGFRKDPSEPSGYRFDPDLAREMAEAKRVPGSRTAGSSTKKGSGSASKPSNGTTAKPERRPNAVGGESAPEQKPKSTAYANAQTDPVYQNAMENAGFKDWAIRIPNNEPEYEKKREVYGWEENPGIAQAAIESLRQKEQAKQNGAPVEEEKPKEKKKTGTWEDDFLS